MGMAEVRRAEWQQKEAGIKPATGDYAEVLEKISQKAFELIKIIELERIRDGDGYWDGSDVIGGTFNHMTGLFAPAKVAA